MRIDDVDWSQFDFIDMGAGSGGSLTAAQSNIGGRGIGIEQNAEKVQRAQAAGVNVIEGDIFALPPSTRVRYVVFDNVLEHLPDVDHVRRAVESAAKVARDFIYIRHPSFEDEAYLHGLGLTQYWTNWIGHPAHVSLSEFMRILARAGFAAWVMHPVGRAVDSSDPTILPLATDVDQFEYDYDKHGPKPHVTFEKPVYYAYDIVAVTEPARVELLYKLDPEHNRRHPRIKVTPSVASDPTDAQRAAAAQAALDEVLASRAYRFAQALRQLRDAARLPSAAVRSGGGVRRQGRLRRPRHD